MHPSDVPQQVIDELCVEGALNLLPVTFITPDALTERERDQVPKLWLKAVGLPGPSGFGLMLDAWFPGAKHRLPLTERLWRRKGIGVVLGRQRGIGVVLVYVIAGTFGRDQYLSWVGRLPIDAHAIPPQLQRLPAPILSMWTQVHNGVDFGSHGDLLAAEEADIVGEHYYDPDWPFDMCDEDDHLIPNPAPQPDWSQVALIFHDQSKTRVCATLAGDPASTAGWLWWEGSMGPLRNIWTRLDSELEYVASDWTKDT